MSEQQTPDERFVAERLQAAAGAREVSPTPEAVMHRGRRMQRRQRLAQGSLAFGVVAGLALGATQVDFAHADRKDVVAAAPHTPPPAVHPGAWCVSHPEANPYGGRWSDGADGVEAARQASEVLNERYGFDTETNRRHLRAGVLGVAGDETTREVVVVVDPSRVSIADLQAQLNRGRDETKNPAPTVVRAGCRSAEDLERFGALLDRRDWHPDARNVDMEYYLGASESSWIVHIDRGPAADELKRQLGNYGTVLRRQTAHF